MKALQSEVFVFKAFLCCSLAVQPRAGRPRSQGLSFSISW